MIRIVPDSKNSDKMANGRTDLGMHASEPLRDTGGLSYITNLACIGNDGTDCCLEGCG